MEKAPTSGTGTVTVTGTTATAVTIGGDADITSGRNYEFTKHFVKAAQKQFQNLDGLASDVSKFVIEYEGCASSLTWHTDTDEKVVTIVDDAFEKTFCRLFTELGLSVFYAYELPLKNIFVSEGATGSGNGSGSGSGSGSPRPMETEENSNLLPNPIKPWLASVAQAQAQAQENHGAIQILATYAGVTCFDHMLESGTTEDLLKALTVEKFWWKWSSWGKVKGKDNLYYFLQKENSDKGQGQGQVQVQGQSQGQGSGPAKEVKFISPGDFFLKPIPVYANNEVKPTSPLPKQRSSTLRFSRSKKVRSLQFQPKTFRGTFNFESLGTLNEGESTMFPRELDDFVLGAKPTLNSNQTSAPMPIPKPRKASTTTSGATTVADKVCKALLRDSSFAWNETTWRSNLTNGLNFPDLATKHNIAKVLKHQKKYEEAYNEFSDVLEMQRKSLGTRHRYTLKTKCTMAGLLENQGRYKEALELYKKILKIQGPSHPDTLRVKSNMEGAMDEQSALKTLTELSKANFLEGVSGGDRNLFDFSNPSLGLMGGGVGAGKKPGGNKRNTIM